MFIFGDGVLFLRESYTLVWRNSYVSCIIWSSLCFWSSMCKFLSPLIVLVPQDLNLTLYAQVCWLCCVLYMPLFGLVQARPWFRSSMWISLVAGISTWYSARLKLLLNALNSYTSENVRHSAAWHKSLVVCTLACDGSKIPGFYWLK